MLPTTGFNSVNVEEKTFRSSSCRSNACAHTRHGMNKNRVSGLGLQAVSGFEYPIDTLGTYPPRPLITDQHWSKPFGANFIGNPPFWADGTEAHKTAMMCVDAIKSKYQLFNKCKLLFDLVVHQQQRLYCFCQHSSSFGKV
jgi:hypothetical protein